MSSRADRPVDRGDGQAGRRARGAFGANLLPQGRARRPWTTGRGPEGRRRRSGGRRIGIIRSCLVTDDPSATGRRCATPNGGGWRSTTASPPRPAAPAAAAGADGEARIPQTWVVGDVDHCVAELSAFIGEYGVTDLVTWGVPPGMRRTRWRPASSVRPRRGPAAPRGRPAA